MVVVNPTAVPIVVLDPAGTPFLRISDAGVETDAAAPFTYLSRHGADTAIRLPAGVVDGAPARWTRVSDDVSWHWHDPRLRPAAGPAPVGGRSDVRQVLGRWSVPLRFSDVATTLDGTLELHPRTGRFVTAADSAPPGLDAVFPDGDRVVLAADAPATVLGVDGEEQRQRLGGGERQPHAPPGPDRAGPAGAADREWQPYAGPGAVSWTDPRLAPPVDVDAAVRAGGEATRWSIPVVLGSGPVLLTGTVRLIPDAAGAGSTGTTGVPVLAAGVVALAAALAALAARNRRRGVPATGDGRTPIERHVLAPAGGTNSMVFTADLPGVFEGEAESVHVPLLRLRVG